MNQTKSTQRFFSIGDSWLYYKLYTGHKTADQVLAQALKPLTEQLLAQGLIDKWFFIRYADPKFHLKVRFRCCNEAALSAVITSFNQAIAPFIEDEFIWKVVMEGYQRELDRYGHNTIEEAESLFLHDSHFVVSFLNATEGPEGEELRWLCALRGIDSLLNAFGYNLETKHALAERLKIGFGREFGMSRFLKKQLDTKYRGVRKKIDHFLSDDLRQNNELAPLLEMLSKREMGIAPLAARLRQYEQEKSLSLPLDDLMSSYIHMFMNRLFRSQNRKYEMVIYDFLYRSYHSQYARLKYQKPK